jgi:hypothetical protein
MFYYYQIRNHHYKTEAAPYVKCPLCGRPGFMHMSIMQKYTWMIGPLAPMAKYAIAWCENCGQYIPRVKWTDEMDTAYVGLKQGLKTPTRLYRGLWVMPLIIVAFIGTLLTVIYTTNHRQQNNQSFVKEVTANPQPGDIFQINHSMGQSTYYTYFKVARTTGDSVYIQEAAEHPTDMKDWDKEVPTNPTAYVPEEMAFSLSKLREMDMFTWGPNGTEYGLVWGVWRNGQLHKKY